MFKKFNTQAPSVATPAKQQSNSTVQRKERAVEKVELTREE